MWVSCIQQHVKRCQQQTMHDHLKDRHNSRQQGRQHALSAILLWTTTAMEAVSLQQVPAAVAAHQLGDPFCINWVKILNYLKARECLEFCCSHVGALETAICPTEHTRLLCPAPDDILPMQVSTQKSADVAILNTTSQASRFSAEQKTPSGMLCRALEDSQLNWRSQQVCEPFWL